MHKTELNSHSIYVNGRFLSQGVTGVQRYAHELLAALDTLIASGQLKEASITVLVPHNILHQPPWKAIKIRQVGKMEGHFWEQLELPLFCKGRLLFTPSGGAPLLHNRNIITIHDAAPFSTPQAYSAQYRIYYKSLQRILARSARHIITVSEFSRKELIRHLHLQPTRISVTRLSGQHILRHTPDQGISSRLSLPNAPYVLAVASRNPNKNISALEAAFASLKLPGVWLALVGGSDSTVFGRSEALGATVRQLGTVTDAELRCLYENASCFVFPSLYEGFGLPPLEALSLGCPIVVSRAASLPEVFGNIATYCDPTSVSDIATKISSVFYGGGASRQQLIEKSNSYTWEKCAIETWSILCRALQESR